MTITVDIKQLVILLLLVALVVLVIYLVILAANAIKTLKKTNEVLDDVKRVTTVAAEKTESVGGALDEAGDAISTVADALRADGSIIDKASNIGLGINSLASVVNSLRTDKEKEFAERARSRRKAHKAKASK